jgi:hypothetical protein
MDRRKHAVNLLEQALGFGQPVMEEAATEKSVTVM